jgi:type IV pilus assembly protein PilB
MPTLQEFVKLAQKTQPAFNTTCYNTSLDKHLTTIAEAHHIPYFLKDQAPISALPYTAKHLLHAVCWQGFPIALNAHTRLLITCNPFMPPLLKHYPNHAIHLTTSQQYLSFLAAQHTTNPIHGWINLILCYAEAHNTTDIHVVQHTNDVKLSFKQQHHCQLTLTIESQTADQLIYYIKLKSHIDMSITQTPQDGAYAFEFDTCKLNIRTATLPTLHGEMLSLRIFHPNREFNTLPKLGFCNKKALHIKQMSQEPHGLLLITGTTGSGKSTTLYTILRLLSQEHRHVITLEDPIEQWIPNIHQTEVNTAQDYTFATGLKAILRHTPQVIAIGEIRDAITAEIVLQAAYSGHLVIASLHTNSIATTLLRLSNLGCSPFLISYCLRGIITQSLTVSDAGAMCMQSTVLHCQSPYIIHDIKKELTAFLEHNILIE